MHPLHRQREVGQGRQDIHRPDLSAAFQPIDSKSHKTDTAPDPAKMIWVDFTRSVRFSLVPVTSLQVMFLSIYGFVSILRYMKPCEKTLITIFYPVLEVISFINAFYFTLSSLWSGCVYTGWFMKLMNWFNMVSVIFANLFCSGMAIFVLVLALHRNVGRGFSVSHFTKVYGAWFWGVACFFSLLSPIVFLSYGFFSTTEDAVWSSQSSGGAVSFTIILFCGYQIFKLIALVITLICLPWAYAIFRKLQKELEGMNEIIGDGELIDTQSNSSSAGGSDKAFFRKVVVSCVFVCVQAILEFSGSISKYTGDGKASQLYFGLTFIIWPLQIIIVTAPYEMNYWMGWFVKR